MKNFYFIAVCFSFALVFAQRSETISFQNKGLNDFLAQNKVEQNNSEDVETVVKKQQKAKYSKSPMMAAGMSLLVPGAGEIYAKSYIRAGIFLAVDAALLSGYFYYDSKGDDKTDEFHKYANANFNEDWYYTGVYKLIPDSVLTAHTNWDFDYIRNRSNWDIDDSYDDVQGALTQNAGLEGFTHNLPNQKTQQYYEMVGKYHQFACGWNDFNNWKRDTSGNIILDTNGRPVEFNLEEDYDHKNGSKFTNDSDNRINVYEEMRDEANKAYDTGQNFLMITLLNHVASAFDAIYVVKSNYKITSQLRIENKDKSEKLGFNNYKLTYSINF